MATTALSSSNLTLADHIKRRAPGGGVAAIVEALEEDNPILRDMPWIEGNLPTGHETTIRSGLPTAYFRRYNQGIAASKSKTIQVTEACAMLESRSVVDVKLARLGGNEAAFRASEDKPFIQSLNIKMADTLFYGNTNVDPEQFHGLTPRYSNYLTGSNKTHIFPVHAGSGSDQSSIWFVTWGEDYACGIYPQGSMAGLEVHDMGIEYEDDGTGKKFRAYRTHFGWDCGLLIKDWRYHARICNIDDDSIAYSDGTIDLIEAMTKAYNAIRNPMTGRTRIYTSRAVRAWVDLQVMNKANQFFFMTEWHGQQISSFRGIPVLVCDALTNAEGQVATS